MNCHIFLVHECIGTYRRPGEILYQTHAHRALGSQQVFARQLEAGGGDISCIELCQGWDKWRATTVDTISGINQFCCWFFE